MKISTVILGVFCVLAFLACGSEETKQAEKMQVLDLTKYHVPLSIQAPESAKVSPNPVSTDGLQISNGADFFVLLEVIKAEDEEDEVELNLENAKSDMLEYQKESGYFSKVLADDKNGFVYEMKDKEIGTTYGFYYTVKHDKERIDFQASPQKKFTQEEIMKMYNAIKSMNPITNG